MATLRTFLPIAAVLLAHAGCQQPALNCTSAHGAFAVRYELKKGDADSPCGALKGELVGAQTYFAEGGVNGTPKFGEPTLGLQVAGSLYSYIYDLGLHEDLDAVSLGDFPAVPNGEDFCEAGKMSKVDIMLPEVPEIVEIPPTEDDPATPDVDETDPGTPGQAPQAATRLVYEWKNISFLVTADAQGTQFSADLVHRQNDCTAEYHAVGVFPAIGCLDEEGKPDNSICEDDENSINPSFPTECEPTFGFCVLKGEPPAYE